jgi:hypothetical protein
VIEGDTCNQTPEDIWTQHGVRVLRLSDVQPEETEWLWTARIPFGAITVLDGDPGLGKSLITTDIAGRLTSGRAMPGETVKAKPSDVVVIATEDSYASTLRPRFDAAGADTERVHLIRGMRDSKNREGEPTLTAQGIARIETVTRLCSARLVIIDPLTNYIPDEIDSYKDQDIRRILRELSAIAQRTGAAFLIVRHLNKGKGSALHRGAGSIGISGAARSVLSVSKGPGGIGTTLKSTKANLAAQVSELPYRIVTRDDGAAGVAWTCDASAPVNESLSPTQPSGDDPLLRAALTIALDTGLCSGTTLVAAIKATGGHLSNTQADRLLRRWQGEDYLAAPSGRGRPITTKGRKYLRASSSSPPP